MVVLTKIYLFNTTLTDEKQNFWPKEPYFVKLYFVCDAKVRLFMRGITFTPQHFVFPGQN